MFGQKGNFPSPITTTTVPTQEFDTVYGNTYNAPAFSAWILSPSTVGIDFENFIGTQSVIPNDLDTTMPVFLDFHILVAQFGDLGDAQLQLQADYVTNNQEFGGNLPATGFAQTVLSGDFAILEPTNATNLTHTIVTVPLDQALMLNSDWIFFLVTRVATTGNEYPDNIYLSSITVRYTRMCS
jgi:hypothetical protein